MVENQSNNFDDFQNFFLHLEALEKIVNFSKFFDRFVVLDMPIVVRVDEIVALRKNIQCYVSFQREKSLQKLSL